ncbi:MAG: N-6 DNA methylase [Deltaproteobacteria bacterium]|nr:N-6 DNA methylase [Deltaproteobacteria bacterium]
MTPLRTYIRSIEKALSGGNATEHTYRPFLKSLVESLAEGVTATNEPRREACGAPDFIITRNKLPVGYIETKDIGKPLAVIENDEQLMRYRKRLGNLILTDYVEFRWYVKGEHRLTARLASEGLKGGLKVSGEGEKQVAALLAAFLQERIALVKSPKDLALRMAVLAQHIRDTILNALADEDGGGTLHVQMEGFRKVLLPEMTAEQFADMYAQTICYGLFAARCNARMGEEKHFVREQAAFDLPKTNPFLRKMFNHIAGPDLDDRIAWIVDDLSNLLDHTDIEEILRDFGKRTRQEDPIIHFYETFLKSYDAKMREARGVYYTPEPVVSYIVRSVDNLLKRDFLIPDGLADAGKVTLKNDKTEESREFHRVLILDPATGTGTFLHSVIDLIHDHILHAGQAGVWGGEKGYVVRHLLPRIFGFELLMAPYAVAHMKLGLQLANIGYDFGADERLRIYLTNTLDDVFSLKSLSPFAEWIAKEANAAGEIKQAAPVMVILGNPPYSGHSANKGQWINHLLKGFDERTASKTDNYFEADGKPLGERNPKWLNDDYVKFIRFAQWRIEKTGYGVLAFVTNHGYLDNPTFRGMRQSLMRTFDEIYLLDLHGNSKKKERCPDGTKDENVFDIQQGVAIGIFVKRLCEKEKAPAVVRHADLWGRREVYEDCPEGKKLSGGKYHWLWENDLATTAWQTLTPQSPFHLFVPQDINLYAEYQTGWKITEIMPVNVLGFQTHRDHFAIDFDKEQIKNRLGDLRSKALFDDELRDRFHLNDNRDWQLTSARNELRGLEDWEDYLIKCLYRPFDSRFCYFSTIAMDYPRRELIDHVMNRSNLCLLSSRQQATLGYKHCWVTKEPANDCVVSTTSREANQVFPLYLYPVDDDKKGLFADADSSILEGKEKTAEEKAITRHPNISPAFIKECADRFGMNFIPDGNGDRIQTFGPEDVFNYMYAVFHSPAYRKRYAEFLKIDFPRLPLTSDRELFRILCDIGGDLVSLHLMERPIPLITSYPVAGDNTVEAVRYSAPGEGSEKGRVWISKTQYFDGVPPEVWDFQVGGYQVCQKWLKDRKGRLLTYDDMTHYQRIVAVLAETIRLMAGVDEAIAAHGGWPIG